MSEQTSYDVKTLKAGGLMKQKEPDLFSVRLRVVGGHLTAEQLEKLAEASRTYGRGHVHLTTRQGVEIPFVAFKDIESLRADLGRAGLEFGACGPRVRTITACQGGSCSHGLIDSQALAVRIDERVFGRSGLPHKFKIGITGCPNACIKPQENDLGIMGIVLKTFHEDLCDRCGLCVHACPIPGALEVVDDRLVYREDICVRCGNCIAACPTDAWERTGAGYALFVGGKMGKRPRFGDRLPLEVQNEDDILAIIDRTIDWYAANGTKGERFGDTLDRIGVEALTKCLR
jgi:dissimilatory sulfite reductase (desulfoviridin) alpha/beta subunit